MSFLRFKSPRKRQSRAARYAALPVAIACLTAGLPAANAGMLEKLLAPAVGTKPGFSEGKKTYDEDTLKPEELMECVIKAHDIDERDLHKPKDVDQLAKERDQLNETATKLKADIEAAKNAPIVEEQAKKLNERIADYKAKEADFNERSRTANINVTGFSKAQNADINSFRDVCAGRRFFKSDLESIRPKLPFDISDILAGKK
jgi:hypothetical protein